MERTMSHYFATPLTLLFSLMLLSCQEISGLSELKSEQEDSLGEQPDGSGGTSTQQGGTDQGGTSRGGQTSGATGGHFENDYGTGGANSDVTSCVAEWRNDTCRGSCGDTVDSVSIGCGNFLDCWLEYDCGPEICSWEANDVCGVNSVEEGSNSALEMAVGVYDCMCGAPSGCNAFYEAEFMMNDSGMQSSDGTGWHLVESGSIWTDHNFADGPIEIAIGARRSENSSPDPLMDVSIGPYFVGESYVNSSGFAEYYFTYDAIAGWDKLRVALIPTGEGTTESPGLIIDYVRVDCQAPSEGSECDYSFDWYDGQTYYPGDRVTFEGNLYECTANSCNQVMPGLDPGWKDSWWFVQQCGNDGSCDYLPWWDIYASYPQGEIVTYDGRSFECVLSSGCPSNDWSHEPGNGTNWSYAWTDRGSCSGTCDNGVLDGQETCIDGGGPSCPYMCPDGASCSVHEDCQSGLCQDSFCSPSTCQNDVTDNGESDVDCGGPCQGCPTGAQCIYASDCLSGYCSGGYCD